MVKKIKEHLPWILFLLIPLGVIPETAAILLVLLFYKWKGMKYAIAISLILFIHFFFITFVIDYPRAKCFEETIRIAVYFVAYMTFFHHYFDGVENMWGRYVKICKFFSYVALFQYFCYLIFGNDPLAIARPMATEGIFLRLHAYFEEPGTYSTFITPCIAYYLFDIKRIKEDKINFACLFVTYIGTFTSIAYVVLAIIFLYKFFTNRYGRIIVVLIAVIGSSFVIASINSAEEYNDEQGLLAQSFSKITDTANAFSDMDPEAFELLNLSSYSLMTNIWVSINAPSRVLGTGIGTHAISYERLYQSDFPEYGLNKHDAYSILTRVFSEFGIIGVFIMLVVVFRYFNPKNIINVSILFFIIASFIRGGHYTYNGLFFFAFMYYYSSKQYIRKTERRLSVPLNPSETEIAKVAN